MNRISKSIVRFYSHKPGYQGAAQQRINHDVQARRSRPQGKNSKKKRGAVIKGAMFESAPERVEGSSYYLMQQSRDPYAKMAKIQNYRCRSAFKLVEIQNEFGIISPGIDVLDIGASPGGWSQVIVEELKLGSNSFADSENETLQKQKVLENEESLLDEIYSMSFLSSSKEKDEEKDVKRAGSCVSCDLRPFREISGAKQIIGDIFEKRTLQQIQNERTHFQLIVSDAHPGASQDPKQTIYSSSQLSQRIIEDVLPLLLSPGGAFVTKALSQKLVLKMKQHFQHVHEKTDFQRTKKKEKSVSIFNFYQKFLIKSAISSSRNRRGQNQKSFSSLD
ncbi:Oidioi.mRNA.OKI2018_I69.XSR.g13382.t1.cds [Oikopleura dioica]|uniref:Oidioi.mRNA.OKI2018_I69.XSR.g13382.t1.cds n=1 Tax=Oikopleura dioica TaxID=34765 RepID=A0ABN7SF40_OIKDI|nr:Oidioi.mRNA.OKI2018_I69.XSR.g13382.t1.cds [Oikopleura dioica]